MTNPSLKNKKMSVIPPNGNRQMKPIIYLSLIWIKILISNFVKDDMTPRIFLYICGRPCSIIENKKYVK